MSERTPEEALKNYADWMAPLDPGEVHKVYGLSSKDANLVLCELRQLRAQVAQLTLELTGCRDLIARIAEAHRPHCATECIEGVWWAKCKSGGVYGPHSTEREALLEVAEMAALLTEASDGK